MIWTRIDAVALSLYLSKILNFYDNYIYGNIILFKYIKAFESLSEKEKNNYYNRAKAICSGIRENEQFEKTNPTVGFQEAYVLESKYLEWVCDKCGWALFPEQKFEGHCPNCGRYWIWKWCE